MTTAAYAVAPGEFLSEWLTERGLSQQQAADLIGCSPELINGITDGSAPITNDTATLLEQAVGIPANSWLRYEDAYRADLARAATKPRGESEGEQ